MILLLSAFSLTLFSCGGDNESSSNPFLGNWTGTASIYTLSAPATVKVTGSGWTFKCPDAGLNETGTMIINGNSATLQQSNSTFGTASVSGNTLSVRITSGPFNGGTGSFTK